jgi:hypothetical protein
MTSTNDTPPRFTRPPTEAVHRLVDAELSLRSRLGYVVLLLAASMMTAVVISLWLTEPALPRRTQLGFAVMTGVGSSWILFAVWVLAHRRPLLAGHALVAGRMAVAFTSLFVIGALAVARTAAGPAPYAAAGVGLVMAGCAFALLRRAHRTSARLVERRSALERELGRQPK